MRQAFFEKGVVRAEKGEARQEMGDGRRKEEDWGLRREKGDFCRYVSHLTKWNSGEEVVAQFRVVAVGVHELATDFLVPYRDHGNFSENLGAAIIIKEEDGLQFIACFDPMVPVGCEANALEGDIGHQHRGLGEIFCKIGVSASDVYLFSEHVSPVETNKECRAAGTAHGLLALEITKDRYRDPSLCSLAIGAGYINRSIFIYHGLCGLHCVSISLF